MKITRKHIIIGIVFAVVILGIMGWYIAFYDVYDPDAGRTW